MNNSEIEQTLASCEFFKGLENENIKEIATLCRVNTYKVGEYVFRQGDFGEYICIIVEGYVLLEREIDLNTRKGNILIDILGKGRIFGCWSTLLDEPHILMASAFCKKPTKVVFMSGADLRKIMLENTEFGFKIMERLAFILRDRIQAVYGALEKI